MKRKTVSFLIMLVMLITLATPTKAKAEPVVGRIGTTKVGSIAVSYTAGNSQVYANKISKSDGTVVRYVYSSNYIVNPESILKLKSVLEPEYSSLIPDDYSNEDDIGITVCSDSSLVNSMDENWTSSEWVAKNLIAIKTVNNVTNETGDGINQTALSNEKSLTALFNEIKNAVEAENQASWEAAELEKKAAWDANEAEQQEKDPTYVPQEYVKSEYVPMDFSTLSETDIDNVKTLEDYQIAIPTGTSFASSYVFIEGKLYKVANPTIICQIASIYTEHTIIDDTENITKINSLNISIKNPKVGDTATETTKPGITLDDNANYTLDHIAYITAYPSEKAAGEYDAPFTGTFETDKEYVVEVSLKAKDGYSFADNDNMTLKVNGKTTSYEKNKWNSDGATYYMFFAKIKASEEPDEVKYTILEGANQTYTKGKELVVRASGDLDKLQMLKVDGKELSSDNYTLKSGSTIATLKNSYLSTLTGGTHTLSFVYNDGSVDTTFEIAKADTTKNTVTTTETEKITKNPKTGDNIILITTIFAIALIGAFTTLKLNISCKMRKH
ncbi:MAG: hypothetical protein K6G26_04530 [Lachnospiraceae bacterium]|nr:hypothetical protein [Lachnospiraceae bacterium]